MTDLQKVGPGIGLAIDVANKQLPLEYTIAIEVNKRGVDVILKKGMSRTKITRFGKDIPSNIHFAIKLAIKKANKSEKG